MASVKDFVQLAAEIMKFTPLAGFSPAASGLAKLLPGGDTDENRLKEINWKIKNIPIWMLMCRQLMDIEMASERKGIALQGRMWADYFEMFGVPPDDSWIEELHTNVYRSVVGQMATEGLGKK